VKGETATSPRIDIASVRKLTQRAQKMLETLASRHLEDAGESVSDASTVIASAENAVATLQEVIRQTKELRQQVVTQAGMYVAEDGRDADYSWDYVAQAVCPMMAGDEMTQREKIAESLLRGSLDPCVRLSNLDVAVYIARMAMSLMGRQWCDNWLKQMGDVPPGDRSAYYSAKKRKLRGR